MKGLARLCAQLLLLTLAGCATQPVDKTEDPATKGDRDTASQLYTGQPSVVHATEFPVASAAEGLQRGDEAYRQGKLDLAIYLYVQSLAFDATAAEPFLKIGAVHEQLGNRDKSIQAYELGLERQPDNAGACERLGLLYLQANRDEDAARYLGRAVELDPKRWRSYNGLGVLADRRKDFDAALRNYNRALKIDPKAALVLNNRGYSRYMAGDPAGAEEDLKAAIAMGARDGAWTNLGKAQAKQGRYAEALEALLREMDLAHAYNVLGEVAMARGDYVGAKRYFEQAISEAPRYFAEAQKNLGLANEKLLAAPADAPSKVARADTPVYSDGVVVGLVERGDRVEVLRVQETSSLVRFRNRSGAEHIGWVPSSSLVDKR